MKIVVIADEALKKELLIQSPDIQADIDPIAIGWSTVIPSSGYADCYIDLLFDGSAGRTNKLEQLHGSFIIVNSVIVSSKDLPANFIRINAWPSLLKRNMIEACCGNDELKSKAETVFALFNKTTEWVADIPGFVTARVISMIINEAYFALEEEVSSKEEIDTAMKLGTNYPYGPFEWGQLIGLKNIYTLLKKLSETNSRYTPAALLQQEALAL
jgi:3-hydroxybutyryl-CoA dehydrogenase